MADEDRTLLYSYLRDKLSVTNDLAQVYRFCLPDFKVGTLDLLVGAGEDLGRLDPLLESTVNRLISSLASLLDGDADQLRSCLSVNESKGKLEGGAFIT